MVASGSDPRSRRLNLGHFAAGRWQVTSPHQSTDRPEVLVSGEGLHAARSTSWARSCMRPAGTATRPCCFSYAARYFVDLDIYSNESVPASGGPA